MSVTKEHLSRTILEVILLANPEAMKYMKWVQFSENKKTIHLLQPLVESDNWCNDPIFENLQTLSQATGLDLTTYHDRLKLAKHAVTNALQVSTALYKQTQDLVSTKRGSPHHKAQALQIDAADTLEQLNDYDNVLPYEAASWIWALDAVLEQVTCADRLMRTELMERTIRKSMPDQGCARAALTNHNTQATN